MNDPLDRLRQDWTPALLAYLSRREESGLRSAYELGRGAIAGGLGVLDVLQVHQGVVGDVVPTLTQVEEVGTLLAAADSFLLEALAPFEMTQRSYLRPPSP